MLIYYRSARNSAEASGLRPYSISDGLSPGGLQMTSPSDMVGPSPVTSNGTETTEIEDEVADDIQDGEISSPEPSVSSDSHTTVYTSR
jgi:hypothetical protein